MRGEGTEATEAAEAAEAAEGTWTGGRPNSADTGSGNAADAERPAAPPTDTSMRTRLGPPATPCEPGFAGWLGLAQGPRESGRVVPPGRPEETAIGVDRLTTGLDDLFPERLFAGLHVPAGRHGVELVVLMLAS